MVDEEGCRPLQKMALLCLIQISGGLFVGVDGGGDNINKDKNKNINNNDSDDGNSSAYNDDNDNEGNSINDDKEKNKNNNKKNKSFVTNNENDNEEKFGKNKNNNNLINDLQAITNIQSKALKRSLRHQIGHIFSWFLPGILGRLTSSLLKSLPQHLTATIIITIGHFVALTLNDVVCYPFVRGVNDNDGDNNKNNNDNSNNNNGDSWLDNKSDYDAFVDFYDNIQDGESYMYVHTYIQKIGIKYA